MYRRSLYKLHNLSTSLNNLCSKFFELFFTEIEFILSKYTNSNTKKYMTTLQQLINEYISNVAVLKNNIIVSEEGIQSVPDQLAQMLNDLLSPLNETPTWNNMTDDEKHNFKTYVAQNPLWLSQQK